MEVYIAACYSALNGDGTAVTIQAEGGALLVKGFIKQHKEKTLSETGGQGCLGKWELRKWGLGRWLSG